MTTQSTSNAIHTLNVNQALLKAGQLQAQGSLRDAEMLIQQVLKAEPENAHALHLLGVIAHQVGKLDLAIQLIERALASNDKVALFHANIGEMYRQIGQLDFAIEHGERAISLDKKMASAHSNLGIAHYDKKEYDIAENYQKRAIALNPKLGTALNNLGSICKERKQPDESIRWYRAAIATSDTYAEPLNNLGAVLVTEQRFSEAFEILKKALNKKQNFSDAHCNMGFALNGLDKYEAALPHFQRALQLKPHYPEALLGIGKLHQGKQLLPKAEQFVLQAIAMDPEKAEFHAALGSIYSEMGEPERAAAQYDNALALDANLSSALLGKGNLLVELGQPEEAEVLLYRALADTGIGSQLAANFGLVQLRKVKAGDKSMQQLVAADAQKQNLAPGQIEYLQFALGKCYDDIGEYDKAFEYYEQGCRIKHSRMRYDADAQDVYFDKLIELFTPEFLEQLRQHANPSDLPVFVLGMPRSGTTLTEQIIASHPQVHGAGELRHLLLLANQPAVSATGPITYPHNLKLFSGEQIRGIANTYIERLRGYSAGALRITDKMPGNFIATGLINALLPNAKIIHVERNPFDTCLSCYMRLFQHGQDFTYDLMELGRYYAGYQRVMAHWRSVLPPGSFYDLHYETLVKDTEDEAKKLLSFCGLEWDPVCLDFHKTERQVRTASVTQVRQPIYKTSVERWRRFEKHLQPLAQGLNIPLDPSIGA